MFLKEKIISDKLENLLFVLFQLLILQNIFCLKEKLIIFVLFWKTNVFSCWVCTRQYHTTCVGLEKENEKFICGSCQRKVQERTLGSRSNQGGAKNMDTPSRQDKFNSSYSKTPVTSSFSRYLLLIF